MVKDRPLVKIEGAFEADAVRLLRAVEGVEVAVRDAKTRGGDARLRFAGRTEPVDIKVKQYLNAAGAWQIVRQTDGGTHHLLVVTDEVTTEARAILERHGVGVIDGAGNAHLELPGLLLHIEGRRRPQEARHRRAARLTGKAGVLAQALLLERDHAWKIHDLAERAGVSDGLAHRVLTRLEGEAIVAAEGAGPNRVRRVVNPTALLDLWAEENVDRAVERTAAYRLARTPKELVSEVAKRLNGAGIAYAVTRAAAAMALAPFMTAVPTVDVWVASDVAPVTLLDALEAERVDTGANLVLTQTPGNIPLAFRQEQGQVWMVNPMRLYYDLRRDPRRGREQAERLRQQVIGL
jgi:hypothetical protein